MCTIEKVTTSRGEEFIIKGGCCTDLNIGIWFKHPTSGVEQCISPVEVIKTNKKSIWIRVFDPKNPDEEPRRIKVNKIDKDWSYCPSIEIAIEEVRNVLAFETESVEGHLDRIETQLQGLMKLEFMLEKYGIDKLLYKLDLIDDNKPLDYDDILRLLVKL